MNDSYITLTRDVEATQIPTGTVFTLPAGSGVLITQALGGSYTVHATSHGGLFRIRAEDGDAIEQEVAAAKSDDGPFDEEKVWAQLRECYDPEIPLNIVDLGLIYLVRAKDDESGKGKHVEVKMTLTAPGCGMGPTLARDAEQRILTIPGVAAVNVELVWEPQWNPSLISPAGKEKLGIE